MDIQETLKQRGKTHGEFSTHAKTAQELKLIMRNSPNWNSLSDDKKECLEMVAHKISRVLSGDPNFHDTWHDIIGYVTLVEQTLVRPPETAQAVINI